GVAFSPAQRDTSAGWDRQRSLATRSGAFPAGVPAGMATCSGSFPAAGGGATATFQHPAAQLGFGAAAGALPTHRPSGVCSAVELAGVAGASGQQSRWRMSPGTSPAVAQATHASVVQRGASASVLAGAALKAHGGSVTTTASPAPSSSRAALVSGACGAADLLASRALSGGSSATTLPPGVVAELLEDAADRAPRAVLHRPLLGGSGLAVGRRGGGKLRVAWEGVAATCSEPANGKARAAPKVVAEPVPAAPKAVSEWKRILENKRWEQQAWASLRGELGFAGSALVLAVAGHGKLALARTITIEG
ncbi:unnamed protein product, partial [Prorocentrum cordatum]